MKENFDSKEYRNKLASDLKEIRKSPDHKEKMGEVLEGAKKTPEYQEAEAVRGVKRELDKIYDQSIFDGSEKNIEDVFEKITNKSINTPTIENTFHGEVGKFLREVPVEKRLPFIKQIIKESYWADKDVIDGTETTQEEIVDKFMQKDTRGGYQLNQYILPLMSDLPQEIAKRIIEYPNQRGQYVYNAIDSYGVFENWDSFKTEEGFKEWAVQQMLEHGDQAYWASLYLKDYEGITKETQQKLVEKNLTQGRTHESINMIPKMIEAGFSAQELPEIFKKSGIFMELKNLSDEEMRNLSPDQWFEMKNVKSTKHFDIGRNGEKLYDRLKNEGYEIEWVEFVKSWSRWTGTGYTSSMYKNKENDLLITIDYNCGGGQSDFWNSTSFSKLSDYESKNKNYAQEVGKSCRQFNIPFDVGLAIGAEGVKILSEKLQDIKNFKGREDVDYYHELSVGIGRRKSAIKEILGEEVYDKLGVGSMGQKNSSKIADYVSNLIGGQTSSSESLSETDFGQKLREAFNKDKKE